MCLVDVVYLGVVVWLRNLVCFCGKTRLHVFDGKEWRCGLAEGQLRITLLGWNDDIIFLFCD